MMKASWQKGQSWGEEWGDEGWQDWDEELSGDEPDQAQDWSGSSVLCTIQNLT